MDASMLPKDLHEQLDRTNGLLLRIALALESIAHPKASSCGSCRDGFDEKNKRCCSCPVGRERAHRLAIAQSMDTAWQEEKAGFRAEANRAAGKPAFGAYRPWDASHD